MGSDPLLSVRGLGKTFPKNARPALQDVTFDLNERRTLAVVGPSGCGKSTLARCIAHFETTGTGEVLLCGRRMTAATRAEVQLIFQQPASTLNPRFTAEEIICEPLVIGRRGTKSDRRARARELMESVGLDPAAARARALEFSGGERQRLALARALAVQPKLLILDESLAGLDLSIQAQIANLLLDLRERQGLTFLLISHHLDIVARLADEIAIMDAGRLVERGAARELLAFPSHPRTRELVAAAAALNATGAAA